LLFGSALGIDAGGGGEPHEMFSGALASTFTQPVGRPIQIRNRLAQSKYLAIAVLPEWSVSHDRKAVANRRVLS
jgi:hypothetical protein